MNYNHHPAILDLFVSVLKFSGHPICDNKALLKELLSADQQIPGRAAVASAGLGCGLVGRRQGM